MAVRRPMIMIALKRLVRHATHRPDAVCDALSALCARCPAANKGGMPSKIFEAVYLYICSVRNPMRPPPDQGARRRPPSRGRRGDSDENGDDSSDDHHINTVKAKAL
ncbi:hypothetical protein C8J57DRAFT_1218641 [Mycena rebaudengoi]|nr:hypothetical protein C8J57DRAFT_1230111 [Mycena rebaudengoi]KAJ7282421.1 hypothetical protein C8J57DRAFT_1218641 [Mycena rebaudengoi]